MSRLMGRAVFLDRDGVLNRAIIRDGKPYPPTSLDELEILPDVPAATHALADAGFLLICVTNQPDVGRGTLRSETVEAINTHLRARLPLTDILTSYESGESARRKPSPGMLIEAAERYHTDLTASFMVGDRWKDIEAGRRAGCTTILIECQYDEPWAGSPPHFRASTLTEAAAYIMTVSRPGKYPNGVSVPVQSPDLRGRSKQDGQT